MSLVLLACLAQNLLHAAPHAHGADAPAPLAQRGPDAALASTFESAAAEFSVPVELLLAIGWEASHLNASAESAWGGRTMFDLREVDEVGGPSLERASALIEADPNDVIAGWRLSVRAAAALLADQAQENNGGLLPPVDELDAWRGAVSAFSGRDEPRHQELYVGAIYTILAEGLYVQTDAGRIVIAPQPVESDACGAPPPSSADTSLAYQWVAACSSNYTNDSRSASEIDILVIHTVQGSYSGCISWFQNCDAEVSAHYVIRSSDGQITQMVHEADIGWHAGNWDYNVRSIGIEHEGYVDDCGYYTEEMYKGSAALAADIAARTGVEPDRSHMIGHVEVPNATHTDPGDCWDWDYYMSLVGGESGEATGEIIGYVRDSDIYNTSGNLVGASVWIAETGDSTTVDGDGLYRFDGIPYGNYTIHADISGYAEGTCASALAGSQDWCSIALFPDSGEDTDDTDTTDTDTDEPTDSGEDSVDTGLGADEPKGAPMPGDPTTMEEVGAGCGCDALPALGSVLTGGLLLAPVVLGRRRRVSGR